MAMINRPPPKEYRAPDYRLRITAGTDPSTYIVRRKSDVDYRSSTESPLALSNLLGNSAAETRFKLEDALDGPSAALIVRSTLKELWKNNPTACPKVEVL